MESISTRPKKKYPPSVLGPPHLLQLIRKAKLLLPQPQIQSPERPPPV